MSKNTENLSTTISISEMQEAISRSGYLIEVRIAHALNQLGFYTNLNYALPDLKTETPREVDIIAWKEIKSVHEEDKYHLNLCIECSNNPQPLVLFNRKDKDNPILDVSKNIKVHGLPSEYIADTHYVVETDIIATQYCSFKRKEKNKGDWMAYHEDAHFSSFNKLVDLEKHYTHSLTPTSFSENCIHSEINFYISVIGGDLVKCDVTDKEGTINPINYGRIVFCRENTNGLDVVSIDIIKETNFTDVVKKLEEVAQEFVSSVETNREIILQSQKKANEELEDMQQQLSVLPRGPTIPSFTIPDLSNLIHR